MPYSSALAEQVESLRSELDTLLDNDKPTAEDLQTAAAKDAELDALEKQLADARNLEEKAASRRKQEKTPLRLINTGGQNLEYEKQAYALSNPKSWADEVLETAVFKAAMANNDFRSLKIELPNRSLFAGRKAAGDPVLATQFGTRQTDMTLIPHVFPPIGVIDLISVTNVGTTNVRYFQATNPIAVNATAFIAEAASKPEIQPRWVPVDAPIETVANWTAVTLQALDDIPQLRTAIDGDLENAVLQKVDDAILNGSGTSPNPRGILNTAGIQTIAFVATTSAGDMIAKGIAAVQAGGYGQPNAVVMNPTDWWNTRVSKTSQGVYLYGNVTDLGTAQIFGLPVVTDPNLAAGNALVGDFRYATIYQRMGITFIVGLKNDDLIKNLQTIVCEERMTLAIRRPGAFAKVALV